MDEHRGRILIVDDEKTNRDILSLLLDKYDVFFAKNGAQTIKIASSDNPPDLILLDIVMPEMNGYEVCKILKANEQTKHIPIIFISVKSTTLEEAMGLEMGAVDYICKPFNPTIVKVRVNNHMELKKQRNILEALNITDALTGIFNRRRFDDYLEQQWQIASRTKGILSVVLMDVDKFKQFNDNYGHSVGDECLINIANALTKAVDRSIDLIARYGGEEFVAVLPATHCDGALQVAEKLRLAIEELKIPHLHSDCAEHVTMSLGVATFEGAADCDVPELIIRADKALYKAKQSGRNRVVLY